MAEGTVDRNYQSISDMDQALGEKFFVHLSGQTLGAHNEWVSKFRSIGHSERRSLEDSDYVLLFCPIVSRVGTDITEALENAPEGKVIVLIVMHHTFNPNYTMADSSGLVENTNRVVLTVDCLFHEGRLLTCNSNDIAWSEIKKLFGVSTEVQVSFLSTIRKWVKAHPWIVGGICAGIVIVVILASVLPKLHKQE